MQPQAIKCFKTHWKKTGIGARYYNHQKKRQISHSTVLQRAMAAEKLFNSFAFTVTHSKGDVRHRSEHMGDAFQVPHTIFPP